MRGSLLDSQVAPHLSSGRTCSIRLAWSGLLPSSTSVPPTFTEHMLGLQGGRNEPGFPLLTWTQTTTSQGSW